MVCIIIFVGFALRLWNLFTFKSYWGDERFSMDLAQKPLPELFVSAINDVHPPLYPIISHFFSHNELTLRLLSLLAGVGTIYVVYLLARHLFNEKTAILASILIAVSPYWLQSSHEIRSYSLLAFLTTFSTYLFFKGRPMRWWFFIFATATLYTEHLAWFWMLTLVLYTTPKTSKMRFDIYVILASLPTLALIVYQSMFKEQVFLSGRVSEYTNFPMMLKKIGGVANHFACGYRYSMMNWDQILRHSIEWQFCAHFIVTLLMWGFAFIGLNKLNKSLWLFSIGWLFLPIFVLGVFYPIRLDARYLSFCAPAFFILVANGLIGEKK